MPTTRQSSRIEDVMFEAVIMFDDLMDCEKKLKKFTILAKEKVAIPATLTLDFSRFSEEKRTRPVERMLSENIRMFLLAIAPHSASRVVGIFSGFSHSVYSAVDEAAHSSRVLKMLNGIWENNLKLEKIHVATSISPPLSVIIMNPLPTSFLEIPGDRCDGSSGSSSMQDRAVQWKEILPHLHLPALKYLRLNCAIDADTLAGFFRHHEGTLDWVILEEGAAQSFQEIRPESLLSDTLSNLDRLCFGFPVDFDGIERIVGAHQRLRYLGLWHGHKIPVPEAGELGKRLTSLLPNFQGFIP
ncbi:hypothetical protein C8J57DRAFT_1345152 [Mycena rebaudengoi]|nr:hypothetical protein C8J57DRAFT_1345152 [Mycena rebaudengoi]